MNCGDIFAGSETQLSQFHKYNLVILAKKQKDNKVITNNPLMKVNTKETKQHDLPPESRPFKRIKYTDVLTRSTIRECTNKNHKLTDIDVEIMVLRHDYNIVKKTVPAIRCKSCEKYYILENEYQRLDSLGTILCNVVEKNYWTSTNRDQDFLISNGESLLHKMGYNVNAYNNVPKSIRWMILRAAFENRLLTKGEIMSHLNTLISRGKARRSFRFAVEKWEMDLEYVRGLSINTESNVTYRVNSITHNKYNKREE